jgi:hypothetical protein
VGLAVGLVLGFVGFAIALVYYLLVRKPLAEGTPPAQLWLGSGSRAGTGGRVCSTCGEPLGTHARYCQNCGTPVGGEA